MKENRPIRKERKAPEFLLVRQEEQNRIFFVASTGGAPLGASLTKMTSTTGAW